MDNSFIVHFKLNIYRMENKNTFSGKIRISICIHKLMYTGNTVKEFKCYCSSRRYHGPYWISLQKI